MSRWCGIVLAVAALAFCQSGCVYNLPAKYYSVVGFTEAVGAPNSSDFHQKVLALVDRSGLVLSERPSDPKSFSELSGTVPDRDPRRWFSLVFTQDGKRIDIVVRASGEGWETNERLREFVRDLESLLEQSGTVSVRFERAARLM